MFYLSLQTNNQLASTHLHIYTYSERHKWVNTFFIFGNLFDYSHALFSLSWENELFQRCLLTFDARCTYIHIHTLLHTYISILLQPWIQERKYLKQTYCKYMWQVVIENNTKSGKKVLFEKQHDNNNNKNNNNQWETSKGNRNLILLLKTSHLETTK